MLTMIDSALTLWLTMEDDIVGELCDVQISTLSDEDCVAMLARLQAQAAIVAPNY